VNNNQEEKSLCSKLSWRHTLVFNTEDGGGERLLAGLLPNASRGSKQLKNERNKCFHIITALHHLPAAADREEGLSTVCDNFI